MGAKRVGCRGVFSIPWKWRGAGMLAAVVMLGASLALPTQGAAEPPGVKLSDSFERTLSPPGQNNLTFHTVKVEVDYRGGPVLLSSTADGSGDIVTDDAMTLSVESKGKARPPFFIGFSRNCIGLESRPPQEVSRLFTKGVNQVTLMLHDRCGVAYSSLPYFLSGQLTLRNKKVEVQLGRGTNGGRSGDPVNTGTGNFYREEIDLQFPEHVFGLTWGRTYNALDNEVGPFGQGWSNSFGARVTEGDDGTVTFRDDDARTFDFPPDGTSYSRPGQFPGELTKEDGAFVIRWLSGETWRFDGDGRILAKRNWDGQQVELTYEGDRLVGATGGYGFQLALAYDASGRPTQATASDGRRITYGYGPTGAFAAVTDPTSATTTYDYDDGGRLTRVVDPDGREVVKVAYGEDGRVLTQQFASGESTSYAYDDTAGTTSVTDKSTGSTVVYGHDGSGQLGSVSDPMGARASRTFDPAGNVITTTARSGATVRQAFDGSGNLTGQEIGAAASRFVYDDQDRLIEATDRVGGVIRYGYTGSSRIPSTVTDPLGGVTHLVVEDGRVTQVTDPDGVTSSFTYDPAGNIVASTDGTGATTRFEYEAAGRRVATISPLAVVERSSHDAAGRLLEATDATGGATRNRYSPGGLLL